MRGRELGGGFGFGRVFGGFGEWGEFEFPFGEFGVEGTEGQLDHHACDFEGIEAATDLECE